MDPKLIYRSFMLAIDILCLPSCDKGMEDYGIIQFIPMTEGQRWPRMDVAGNWIYQNTDPCEIWPYCR